MRGINVGAVISSYVSRPHWSHEYVAMDMTGLTAVVRVTSECQDYNTNGSDALTDALYRDELANMLCLNLAHTQRLVFVARLERNLAAVP